MSFVRQRGRVWHLCFRDRHGRRKETASKARSRAEARRLADEVERREERIRLGLEEGLVKMRFSELAEHYRKGRIPSLRGDNGSVWGQIKKHLLPAFGTRMLHEVRPADIETFLVGRRQTLSDASREKLRLRLQTMFEYARKKLRAFNGENPAKLVERIRPQKQRPRFLPAEHVPRILAAAAEPNLLAFAFFMGLRKGELAGLLVEDVDLPRRQVRIWRSYDGPTKGNRERYLPIPELLIPYLKEAIQEALALESAWLFPDAKGRMRTRVWNAANAFRAALKAANLLAGYEHICRRKGCGYRKLRQDDAIGDCPDCGFRLWVEPRVLSFTLKHARSTWATWSYRATRDIRFVQAGLGHADVKTTEDHYAHLLHEHQLEQANRLAYGPPAVRALPHDTDKKAQAATTQTKDTDATNKA